MYEPTKRGAASGRWLVRSNAATAGTAAGSIVAAIIGTQIPTKEPNEPRSVATPMSIPLICRTLRIQQPAASPSVAAAAVVDLIGRTRRGDAPGARRRALRSAPGRGAGCR